MRVRRARPADIPEIRALIAHYAGEGILLPRDEHDIRRHLDFFLVAADRSGVAGCVSLEVYHPALAEIRSLAVTPAKVGRGLGARLVKTALERAERRRIARVFALTSSPDFFVRLGFEPSTRHSLHEKIDRDCIHCSKARTCQLTALVANLSAANAAFHILDESVEPVPVE
jgi:N-acetylglutamate synthase-like GNAT family acetyltransferase